jgi:hypothetical protein
MIYPQQHNGIDFSGSYARESDYYNFDKQRIKNLLPSQSIEYLCFEVTDPISIASASLKVISSLGTHTVLATQRTIESNIVYFKLIADDLPIGEDICFVFSVDSYVIYSELYTVIDSASLTDIEICTVTASNSDNRHGYLAKAAFGFFKVSKFKSDIFLNKKIEYEYSYSRKKILSSENKIGKRLTFKSLTMYNANLIKWLCNCETLTIDGVAMQLISDFTELETDANTETMSLQADFVEVSQFSVSGYSDQFPTDIKTKSFFI